MTALTHRRFELPADPQPYWTYLHCPCCGQIIQSRAPGEIGQLDAVEEACRAHLETRHPLRLWLYDRFGWKWQIRGLV